MTAQQFNRNTKEKKTKILKPSHLFEKSEFINYK